VRYNISDFTSLIGTYHKRDLSAKKTAIKKIADQEPLLYKAFSSFLNSIRLSLPLFLAFFTIVPTVIKDIRFEDLFCMTLILTLSFLVGIRVASNPTKTVLLNKIQEKFNKWNYSWKDEEKVKAFFCDKRVIDIAKNHKERMMSFSCAFILGAMMLVYIYFINLDFSGSISHKVQTTIDILQIFYYIFIYIISLFLFILIAEIILWWWEPIIEE